jgi:hypothetical protein
MILRLAGFLRGDKMPTIQAVRAKAAPSIVPRGVPAMSDDECLVRLAQAIKDHDSDHLEELAWLIGRLAVTIE